MGFSGKSLPDGIFVKWATDFVIFDLARQYCNAIGVVHRPIFLKTFSKKI